jgi:hypothetical protein
MRFMLLTALILNATTSYAELKQPDTIKATRMICSEQCQRWDSFDNHCDYRTTCQIMDNMVTYKECLRWDSFNDRCGDEKVVRQYLAFDAYSGSPSCTESCQIQDGFGACLYRATCNVQPHCASIKYCEKWDSFNRICSSERIDSACNLRN